MPFDRLQALGDEKFTKILNLLMRGESAMGLARTMQQPPPNGWGVFQDIAEKTLTQQLNRLRLSAAEGTFGARVAKRIADGATVQIRKLEHVSVRALDRLEDLSEMQRERIVTLIAREKQQMTYYASINAVAENYRQLLLDIQKIRFDLGLDEFKGPVSGTMTMRGGASTTTFPDGTNVQKQVFEAITTIEQIFDARRIPQVKRVQ